MNESRFILTILAQNLIQRVWDMVRLGVLGANQTYHIHQKEQESSKVQAAFLCLQLGRHIFPPRSPETNGLLFIVLAFIQLIRVDPVPYRL